MIRIFVLILILVNAAFFVWMRFEPSAGSPEAQLVHQQINPGAIRLLPAQSTEGGAVVKNDPLKLDPLKLIACIEWGAFNAADIARAQNFLGRLDAKAQVSERRADEPTGWWVYIPPQPNRQSANQKIAELRSLGLTALEYFIVQDDPKLRFAISLGVYRSEEAARNRMAQLRDLGVRSAQVDRRTSPMRKVFLQLRELPDGLREKLAEIKEDFPGTDMRECR